MSDLDGHPKDPFSRATAQFYDLPYVKCIFDIWGVWWPDVSDFKSHRQQVVSLSKAHTTVVVNTQEKVAVSQHYLKFVDWDVKP